MAACESHGVFFFNDTATTEIYTLSLHDALPISPSRRALPIGGRVRTHGLGSRTNRFAHSPCALAQGLTRVRLVRRSEEHTSELQSRQYLVCRLLLEKKQMAAMCCIHCHNWTMHS